MRNGELFWNADRTARALDVTSEKLMELVRLEMIPMPVVLAGETLWNARELRAWAAFQGAANPAQAVAALWAQWEDQELSVIHSGEGGR